MNNKTQNKQYKKLTIFLVNFDWRNIYRESFIELEEKLERDRLQAKVNDFFFFSWAKENYVELEGKYKTLHIKTFGIEKFRPLLDMWSWIAIPFSAHKYVIRPDAWVTYDFGMVPALWITKKLFGGKLIMVLNNQPRIYSQTRKFGKVKGMYSWVMERIGVHFIDHVLTINNSMREYIINLGVPSEKITVFSMNTIDRDAEFIQSAQKGFIRKKYNLPADTKILLTVARLEAEKNYPRLLELFTGLPKNYVLFALGRGSMLPQLQAQAKKLDISDRVYFEGYVHRKAIWNYFKDADAFVLISKAEALGVVLWEAIYTNVPIVCSDVEGILETVGSDGERGRVWRECLGQVGFSERVRFCVEESSEKQAMLARAKKYLDTQIANQVTINTLSFWK